MQWCVQGVVGRLGAVLPTGNWRLPHYCNNVKTLLLDCCMRLCLFVHSTVADPLL